MYLSQILDEGIFKAGTERSETRGAAEVQEDEDTQVEVPVDQVISLPLKLLILFSCGFCVICSCAHVWLNTLMCRVAQ